MSYILYAVSATGRRFATVKKHNGQIGFSAAVGPKQGCQNGFEEDL